jgi:predicted DNA-binding antitoxin AbrB/MazE fold protein
MNDLSSNLVALLPASAILAAERNLTDCHAKLRSKPTRRAQNRHKQDRVFCLLFCLCRRRYAGRCADTARPSCAILTLTDGWTMTQITEAIYTRGVLKPTRELDLREDQRVRVIVESLDEPREDRTAALARLKAGIASMQFFSGGRLPSRAELHDRP